MPENCAVKASSSYLCFMPSTLGNIWEPAIAAVD